MPLRPSRAEVRAGIQDAAAAAFERDGYAGASLAGIAESAGFTKGAVYSGFSSKAELFAEVCRARFERVSTETLETVRPALEGEEDRAALIGVLAEHLADTAVGPAAQWQVLMHEFQTVALHDSAVREVYQQLATERVTFLVDLFCGNEYLARMGRPALTRSSVVLLSLTTALAVEHVLVPGTVDRASVVTSVHAILDGALPARGEPKQAHRP